MIGRKINFCAELKHTMCHHSALQRYVVYQNKIVLISDYVVFSITLLDVQK